MHEPEERELFGACLDLTPEERRRYLARTCRDRPGLRRRIEDLLAAHERADREGVGPLDPLVAPASEAPTGPGRTGAPLATPPPPAPRRRVARAIAVALVAAALAAAGGAVWRARAAGEEARRLAEVQAVLVAALRDASPHRAPARPPTVPDLASRLRSRLELEPGRPPEVRVDLLSIVGETLLAHGDPAAAERALDDAVAEAERSLGEGHRLTLRARVLLASADLARGRTEGLREELEGVLPALRAAPGGHPRELVLALQGLARLAVEEGRHEAAAARAAEALAVATRYLGPVHPETASAAATVALAALHGEAPEEALARAEEALHLTRDAHSGGAVHPQVLEAEMLYARALFGAGDLADGLARAGAAAERAAEVFGAEGIQAGRLAGELARLRLRRGDARRALEASAVALGGAERHSGVGSLRYATALALHGEALLAARRVEEAAAELARAGELLAARLGPSHERVRAARASRALALAYGGEAAGSLRQLVRVVPGGPTEEVRGSDDLRHALGVARRLAGQPAAALHLQQERLAGLPALPATRLERWRARSEIGLALVELGRHDEATTPLLRALTTWEELGDEMMPDRADLLVALGRARLGQGRPAEALEPLEAADRFWREHAPESPWAAEAARWLARCRDDGALSDGASRRVGAPSPHLGG